MGVTAAESNRKSLAQWLVGTSLVVLLILTLPFLAIYGVSWVVAAAMVHLAAWVRGLGRPWVVVAYSDSPNWKEHIEEHVLPSLGGQVSVLNLSRRKQWSRLSLGRYAFQLFAGGKDYCPIVLVFRPGKRVREFRFYRPFVEAKHGNQDRLRNLEGQVCQYIGSVL